MRRVLHLALLLLAFTDALAQRFSERKRSDIIPLEGQAKRIGWFVGPGLTYTLSRFTNREEEVFSTPDSSCVALYDPVGRFGFHLEAGASWYMRDPVIVDYLDLGLAYKELNGAELSSTTLRRSTGVLAQEGEGSFAERMLTLSFNANKFIPTRAYQFVQLSLGANADLRLGGSRTHTADPVVNRHVIPPDLWAQLHFKVGYGFKLTGHIILIPAVETPVFSFVPEDRNFGMMRWFSSDHRPLIFSLRFLFLRARDGWTCPPVRNNEFERHKVVNPEYKPR
jgi:hypothetical protein